jgi:hypothetical protein
VSVADSSAEGGSVVTLAYDIALTDRNLVREVVTRMDTAYRVAGRLVLSGVWYVLTPLPDDGWQFAVKPEAAGILRECIRLVQALTPDQPPLPDGVLSFPTEREGFLHVGSQR